MIRGGDRVGLVEFESDNAANDNFDFENPTLMDHDHENSKALIS